MPEAFIVSAVRTPVGRAYKGSLRATRPDDLAALVIKEAIARVPGLSASEVDDVILGCAMLTTQMAVLKRFGKRGAVDTITLRRQVAAAVQGQDRYPFESR